MSQDYITVPDRVMVAVTRPAIIAVLQAEGDYPDLIARLEAATSTDQVDLILDSAGLSAEVDQRITKAITEAATAAFNLRQQEPEP